jgi:penicillin-binding protein 2
MSDNSRVRVSIVGVVIVALFGSLVARLWFLQMGPERALGQEAIALSTRVVQTESPRGRILDRNGKVLAQDVAAWAVTVDRTLTKKTRTQVMGQLSELLGLPEQKLQAAYDSPRQSPLKPAIVALNVSLDKRLALLERQQDYPGVHVEELTVRRYPMDGLASQLLGYVGEIGADQLKTMKRRGYQAGDLIGRDGVEAAYESVLRGTPEQVTLQVDPRGLQVGPPINVDPGKVGDDVYLTIESNVQRAAEQALAEGIATARTQQNTDVKDHFEKYKAPAGSVVVLDAKTGAVVAMASYPTYPLSWWVGGITQDRFGFLSSPLSNNPLLNRATEGQYAPGSAFKLVTSVAMTRYGMRGPFQPYDDTGSVKIGNQVFTNDTPGGNGSVALGDALMLSSDTYFYTLGNDFWTTWRAGDATRGLGLQQEARDFGFGSTTGIELSEGKGRVPDPTWKHDFANAYYKSSFDKQQNEVWYPGDEVHLAVGQGDVLVTPLQLADAYAAFANRGTLVTPHVGMKILDPMTKKVDKTITPAPRGKLTFDPTTYDQMLQGFENVVASSHGTAYAAFQGFPLGLVPVAGKTGTAQVAGKAPTSVFSAFFPANNPQYVVVAMVEEAGHGAQTAAPIVRRVIDSILNPLSVVSPNTPITPIAGGRD